MSDDELKSKTSPSCPLNSDEEKPSSCPVSIDEAKSPSCSSSDEDESPSSSLNRDEEKLPSSDLKCDENDSNNSRSAESENETGDSDSEYEDDNIGVFTNRFTPFNMKEELEDGYFDSEGTYHWKKKPKLADYWLDNLDNYGSEAGYQKIQQQHSSRASNIDKRDPADEWNALDMYKKILCYLQPKETISQALCRLGRNNNEKLTTIERWKRKRQGTLIESDNAKKIADLTGLTNDILSRTGDFDIYESTYEGISEKINNLQKDSVKVSAPLKDPELDMFSDEFEEKEKSSFKEKCNK